MVAGEVCVRVRGVGGYVYIGGVMGVHSSGDLGLNRWHVRGRRHGHAGKTRVGFAVAAAALHRHPRRTVVFLCPTVPLANQQRDYWEECGVAGQQLTSAVVAGTTKAGFGLASVTFAFGPTSSD